MEGRGGQNGGRFNQGAPIGRVNHVTIKEVEEVIDVIVGKFLINIEIALVLFDPRATHSFVSKSFALKSQFPLFALEATRMIHSPGAKLLAPSKCRLKE